MFGSVRLSVHLSVHLIACLWVLSCLNRLTYDLDVYIKSIRNVVFILK